MAEFFIRRPIVAMVIAILTVIVGAISLSRLPIAEYPPVSPTMIQATANYRGAAAEAVMQSVATPIETKVNGEWRKPAIPFVFRSEREAAECHDVDGLAERRQACDRREDR